MHTKDIPRSWALIGPYGSGKSSFAIFLSHLLGNPKNSKTKAALQILHKEDEQLENIFSKNTKQSKGYLSVMLTGSPEPFAKRFLKCLYDSAINFWENRRGPMPKIVEKLQLLSEQKEISLQLIISHIEKLQKAISKIGGKGIVFILDEFGKFLEYDARHYGTNDIYLMQLLAELARNGNKANILIFVLMHQGFEQYAKGLGENLRNEWSKIQGRYESIPFLETTEQILKIMSRAFIADFDKKQKKQIYKKCHKIVNILAKEKALPGILDIDSALDIFSRCYPLHPLSTLILPFLCNKMAQNERTLFSYLGSKEIFGFNYCINELTKIGQWVAPWEIYEYFILNQPAVLDDPITHRRWAEVVTAIERLGDAPVEQIQLLKTIGILNIIGAQGGLKASKEIIKLCMTNEKKVMEAVKKLQEKSIIQFRKYSSEYRVWQGSDFDLDLAVKDELNQMGLFNLPQAINKRTSLQPIVARRHTIRTGTLRYFQPIFVDSQSYSKENSKSLNQRIIIFLSESPEDTDVFFKKVLSFFSEVNIVALWHNGIQLREAVGEVLALDRVLVSRQELNSDVVAKREFNDRLSAAEQLEDTLLTLFIDKPQDALWYWKSKKISVNSKRDLQKALSSILDQVYHYSPIIKNELINRDKPSAQAIAARNKLVLALRYHEDKEDLGIDKFPPEKAIYRALLKASGIHQKEKDHWKIMDPTKQKSSEKDHYNIRPVWKKIKSFIFSTKKMPKSFAELDKNLLAPPYGLKAGILPLMYFTVYTCYQDDLAFYENGNYIPYITDQHIERFLKRPQIFSIQHIWMNEIRASLFKQYIKLLYGDESQKKTLLSITRQFAQFMSGLEDYTKNTTRISDTAQKVRKSFDIAKSPDDLLFNKLPKACGFDSISPDDSEEKKIDDFAVVLVKIIRELKQTYEHMLLDMQKIISKTLLFDISQDLSLSKLRIKVRARYEDLHKYTTDVKDLKPFIENLSAEDCTDENWINKLLLFLSKKAPKRWTDVDRDNAVFNLTKLSKRLIDLRILQDQFLKNKTRLSDKFDVFLLRSMKHGNQDYDKIVTIDKELKNYISNTKDKMMSLLNDLKDDKARFAILAEMTDKLMAQENKKIIQKDKDL